MRGKMSKINAVRFINLNYNHNAIRISDETFQLNGKSTLLSLRNGGGKSVLVQMMTAPFVHKRYRDTKDRPFSSYFTTNKPTFILVEWKLDQDAGYVLTGMMVRRNQEISEEHQDELEMINIIAEYRERCMQDIYHLPVVEKTKKDITLKGFHVCRQLFESYKRERNVPFFYYDMNNSAQSKQYFDKLMEYQINYKEWESIIKKVNLKESGLSELFADCRDEKGLVDKWFLEAVENKLNKDKNRMKEFQSILEKYTGQYKDNQSKIKRRDTIRAFGREAERIRAGAVNYQRASEELEEQKNRIADFIHHVKQLNEQEKENAEAAQLKMEELSGQLSHLEYEKLSGEIYQIEEQENFSAGNLEMLQIEKEDLERGKEVISHKLHVLACARQQENAAECKEELEKENQRLLLCRKKEEDLEPERNRLGMQLKEYYLAFAAEKEKEKDRCSVAIGDMLQQREQEWKRSEELQKAEGELSEQAGALGARIRAFDETEGNFNREYRADWCRNILGEYEGGSLQIRQMEYEKQLSETERQKTSAKNETEQYKKQRKSLQRLIEDKTADKIHLESERETAERQLEDYERELAERSVILRYFGLEQTEGFDTEKILLAARRQLADTDRVRQGLEKEADVLEKEYRNMAQGQVLELSEEFRGMLEEAGIHFVYGMEWLKKNQYPLKKNKKLVEEHPFLPYSLILSRNELERLAALPRQVYTSFPVPILIREELEQKEEGRTGAVRSLANVNFYIWFNDNLLEEEKLRQMLAEKADLIEKLKQSIAQKKQEYAEYIEKQEKIKNHKVTKENYEAVKEKIAGLKLEYTALEQELLEKREEQEELEKLQAKREQQIAALEQDILFQTRRLSDFARFCQSYEEYQENRRMLEKNKREKERLLNQKKLVKEKIAGLEEKIDTEKNRLLVLERELEDCEAKQVRYQQYRTGTQEQEELTAAKVKEAEARYEVITGGISAQQKELEARAEAAGKRYGRALEELNHLKDKYRLTEDAWLGVRYDRKEETHQEVCLEDQERKLRRKDALIHDEEIRYALLKQDRENKFTDLRERCRKEEPMAKENIQTIDFTEAMKKLEYERGEAQKESSRILKKIQGYESNLAALAEYEDFVCDHPAEWEIDFSAMTGQELTKQKGILVRDYNSCVEQRRDARSSLERVLNQIIRMVPFGEEFYQKPLEAMLQLTYDAGRVVKQLDTTLASYNSLMEKLLVDISMVEKEKAKIVELIGDYLKEVHENLNRIDHNSTITIRERPVKMLKIELPDWTENENLYELRLQDYIDDITARGIALLEENKNVQEFLGTKVTTKGLYDAVVGIGNVQIRLYKIEEQREYAITWADVARNSGGEGFLSAFVILSALLYYMRRDETDIFADRNEGKVLVMDNPFAQTNASHLLKPLMDMAKKTNTQLICLSGLGGESIYNQFDNIYVLTLIAANLRNDMQYLRADHMRGSEEETMIASRIEVMEQQELIF